MTRHDDPSAALLDLAPSQGAFLEDVLTGLGADEKHLPCKYFYDRRGSKLFDRICELDEYYLTRTELEIMEEYAAEMANAIGNDAVLIEFGSGSSTKTRLLLDHLHDAAAYVPVDISRGHLLDSAKSLAARYPAVPVIPVSADFTEPFDLPESIPLGCRRIVYFPGSTIGNFDESAADFLLEQIAELCGAGGGLLIGIDLIKERPVLEAAYNDAEGVTAEFNRNILQRINRELDADFDLDEFEHKAVYDAAEGRMEISLVSQIEQTVTVGDEEFDFAAGEGICTEYSHKYNLREFAARSRRTGFQLRQRWTDERHYFAVLYLTAENR